MKDTDLISERYEIISPFLDEKSRRLMVAVESKVLGYGGIGIVSELTGVSRSTISAGLKELKEPDLVDPRRIRKEGGGRKKAVEKFPAIEKELEQLVEPALRGEPDSPLMWTSKSLRKLSAELKIKGLDVSHKLVGEILKIKGFSLQANRKTDEGKKHPDGNAQFEYIHGKVKYYQKDKQPVISVDAKKKELIGNFKNNGKQWHKEKEPVEVNVYDFLSNADGKAIPYGVYDLSLNKGWVSVGIDHDTAEFAVETIKKWWMKMGKQSYPDAQRLLITADGGGSNASRSRLWKTELQKLSDQTGLIIDVCHFPPGTSKWNKIEHRLFSYISQNWRGKPLLSYEVIVSLIASTKTLKGLEINCELDKSKYETGIKIEDQAMEMINLERNDFHGEWNYTIKPSLID